MMVTSMDGSIPEEWGGYPPDSIPHDDVGIVLLVDGTTEDFAKHQFHIDGTVLRPDGDNFPVTIGPLDMWAHKVPKVGETMRLNVDRSIAEEWGIV